MIYSYRDLLKKHKNRYQIDKALLNKEIFKLEKSIYSDKEYGNEMDIIMKKYPFSIFTMDTAFYIYGLTDVIPKKYDLAIPVNRKKIPSEKINSYYISNEFFNIGKQTINYEGATITIYDKERMLIELVRNKKQIAYDYYKEIISNYREISEKIEMWKLEEYLKYFKNSDSIFKTMQTEVF